GGLGRFHVHYGTYQGKAPASESADAVPGFRPESELLRESQGAPEVAHTEGETSASPEAGRPWASGQLVFNAGSVESARSGFAEYARDGETAAQLRASANRVIIEDLEQRVLALRALHAKFRDVDAGESFGRGP
ncbi:MAG: hypothetical protein ACREEC_12290, partial [Thermoplasmata archaeon]